MNQTLQEHLPDTLSDATLDSMARSPTLKGAALPR